MTQSSSLSRDSALRAVTEIVVEELGLSEDQVAPDTDLVQDLHVDTDDLSFLYIPAVHKRFGVTISNDEWRRINTVRQTVDAVLSARAAQSMLDNKP